MSRQCEYCVGRKAVCAGMPNIGPMSYMCVDCQKRICKKKEDGSYDCISIEEAEIKFPKGFYHP